MNTNRRPCKLIRRLIRQLRKLNLFSRLLMVFCTLLIVSTIFITFFNHNSYAREMEIGLTKYLSVLVQNASFKLDQERGRFEEQMTRLIQSDHFLETLAENKSLKERVAAGDADAVRRYDENTKSIEQTLLQAKKRQNGIKALILVMDEAQYSMAAGANDSRGAFIRDLDSFHESEIYTQAVAAQGYPVWRDSVQDAPDLVFESSDAKFGIEGCITLSYQVYQPGSRKPLGVLVCCIYPKYFTNALSEYSSQNGGNTFIVGENGMIEGISAGFSAPPFIQQRSGLLKRIFSQHQGNLMLEADDQQLLASFCGQPDFPLHIVNLTYREHIMDKVDQLGRINILVMCLVILIGSGGFYLTAVSISYPVNKLIRSMKRVGAGDFSAVYKAESHDEIGVLCSEFDHMVSDMKSLIDRVYVAELRESALELSQKTAQLDALQMQINPHFLYNTLDMIRWECMYEAGGESAASDMIEKFCTLLRMTIKGDQKEETVHDSLLHASTYLDVVNFRHTNKILLKTDLSFDPCSYMIPCLALQPILENAVRHGFEVDQENDRLISITGEVSDKNRLVLRISDNGSGMSQEQLEALRENLSSTQITKNGIGLRNVNQRCHLCYGQEYGIHIDSKLGKGTVVTLTVPLKPTV